MPMAMNAIFTKKISENIRFHLPPWLPGMVTALKAMAVIEETAAGSSKRTI